MLQHLGHEQAKPRGKWSFRSQKSSDAEKILAHSADTGKIFSGQVSLLRGKKPSIVRPQNLFAVHRFLGHKWQKSRLALVWLNLAKVRLSPSRQSKQVSVLKPEVRPKALISPKPIFASSCCINYSDRCAHPASWNRPGTIVLSTQTPTKPKRSSFRLLQINFQLVLITAASRPGILNRLVAPRI